MMTKLSILFTLFVISILFSGCQKTDDDSGNNNPGTSNGNFSCTIGNQVYNFKDIEAKLVVSSNEEDLEIKAYMDKGSVENQTYIEFKVLMRPTLATGVFKMNNELSKDTVVTMFFKEMSYAMGGTWDSKNNVGQVNLGDLNRENSTVSGAFSGTLRLFEIVGGGDYPQELTISNGTFNGVTFLYTN
jgi:hypothetical protein